MGIELERHPVDLGAHDAAQEIGISEPASVITPDSQVPWAGVAAGLSKAHGAERQAKRHHAEDKSLHFSRFSFYCFSQLGAASGP